MFKRPFTSKTSSPLRSSDLRKLRQELSTLYSLSSTISKLILPEGLLVQKALTHLSEPILIYSSPNSDPRAFRLAGAGKGLEGTLFLTIYSFDLVPNLLPVLVTAPQVVEVLVGGAALFCGGVSEVSLRGLPDGIKEGELVAIRAQGKEEIVALGQLANGREQLIKADGKGKAAITLHARGDFLWASGTGESSIVDTTVPLTDSLATTSLEPNASSKDVTPPPPPSTEVELSPSDVDTLLRNALLLSISHYLRKNPSLFPLSASALYSTYILPYRPANSPQNADIKHSSFKKLATLIKTANKAGLLVSKEVKGELLIMSVNDSHPDVDTARSYKTMAQAASQQSSTVASSSSTTTSSNTAPTSSSTTPNKSSLTSIQVIELYKPLPSSLPFFLSTPHTHPPSNLYTSQLLKTLLTNYITTHSLLHPRDQKYLRLDGLLSQVLLKKDETLDVMIKDEAVKRLKESGCQSWWSFNRKGGEGEGEGEVEYRKGSPPKVKVAIKNVGKRQVTLVSGHEPWQLFTSEDFAEVLKHRSASSTAVQPLAGSTKKGGIPKVEIMCQGTHDVIVVKALMERGVPKAYIEVDTSRSKR